MKFLSLTCEGRPFVVDVMEIISVFERPTPDAPNAVPGITGMYLRSPNAPGIIVCDETVEEIRIKMVVLEVNIA